MRLVPFVASDEASFSMSPILWSTRAKIDPSAYRLKLLNPDGTIRLLRGQPEPPQLRIESHPGDPERGRRDRLVALGLREGILDRVSFELLKGRRRRILIRGA